MIEEQEIRHYKHKIKDLEQENKKLREGLEKIANLCRFTSINPTDKTIEDIAQNCLKEGK